MMPRVPYKIAFQLYTTREQPSQEIVLQALAEIGFDAVEAWLPDYNDDPKGFRARLDAAGLTCMAIHMPFRGLVEDPQRYIDIAKTVGDETIMIPPYLVPADRPEDIEGWKRIGGALAQGAAVAKAAGLRLAWHNHEFEFRLLADGSRPIDHLLAEGGPDLGFEIDFAWVMHGWADPAAELQKYADRITVVQLKDTAAPGTLDNENGWRACGDGVVDWSTLWPLFPTTASEYLVVEHDRPADWRRTALRSYNFARGMGLDR